jgi:hypothetical protein
VVHTHTPADTVSESGGWSPIRRELPPANPGEAPLTGSGHLVRVEARTKAESNKGSVAVCVCGELRPGGSPALSRD